MAQIKGSINLTPPEREFYWNNVLVKLVPWQGLDRHPVTGIAFYVNSGRNVIGVQVFPNGTKHQVNATYAARHKDGTFHHDKQPRYQFRDAWGYHQNITASRAVYLAWVGPIEPGMTIDHIDGCATNNDYRNLRQITLAINLRDGGFLRKLKKAGFNVMAVDRAYLLRFFDRMAQVKEVLSYKAYRDLTKEQLRAILYCPEWKFLILNA